MKINVKSCKQQCLKHKTHAHKSRQRSIWQMQNSNPKDRVFEIDLIAIICTLLIKDDAYIAGQYFIS